MAWTSPHAGTPEGRIIPLYHLDVHVEARRVGAATLDLLILAIVWVWVGDVFGVPRVIGGAPVHTAATYTYVTTSGALSPLWLIVVAVALFTLQEALFGATWGKLVAGLRVVDEEGRCPGFMAVLVRNVLRVVDYWPVFYLAGAIIARVSPRRQRLGDRVAHTLVVRADSAVLAYLSPAEVRRRLRWLLLGLALVVAGCLAFAYVGRPPLVIEGLRDSGALVGDRAATGYVLGTPRWGAGRVTYPFRYVVPLQRRRCSGTVTLRWTGFFNLGGGWVLEHESAACR